jgi:hypothetical protein
MFKRPSVILFAVLMTLPVFGSAHHSPSMFDGDKEMTLSGTVREFQWSNPHSYIQLIVATDDGTEQEWSLEMGANAYLYNLGWRPSTIKPGDELTIRIVPLRNGGPGGLVMDVMTADGESLGGRA